MQTSYGRHDHEDGTAIVLAYVLVSMGVIITFLLAAFVIGWFIGRLRQRRREQRGVGSVVAKLGLRSSPIRRGGNVIFPPPRNRSRDALTPDLSLLAICEGDHTSRACLPV